MVSSTDLAALWTAPWAFSTLMIKSAETLIASSSVIASRSGTIAAACASPMKADSAELGLMVHEKVTAFGRSHALVAKDVQRAQTAFVANAEDLQRMMRGQSLLPTEMLTIAQRNVAAIAALVSAPMRALQPIHATATANAKRLG